MNSKMAKLWTPCFHEPPPDGVVVEVCTVLGVRDRAQYCDGRWMSETGDRMFPHVVESWRARQETLA